LSKFNLIEQDGASLTQAMVSKEAKFFRQQFCRVIAGILHQWMFESLVRGVATIQFSSNLGVASGPDNRELGPSSRPSTPIYDYRSILKDRRLKVIFLNILNSTRKDPILLLRFCWTSFVMFVVALALASHRVLISLSEAYLGPISLASKQYAIP
jgi:aarF domain-containing kinase